MNEHVQEVKDNLWQKNIKNRKKLCAVDIFDIGKIVEEPELEDMDETPRWGKTEIQKNKWAYDNKLSVEHFPN